jgi:hypothetical protein
MKPVDQKSVAYLPVNPTSSLFLVDTQVSRKSGVDNEDWFYEEIDQKGNVLCKYHVWHHMETFPPQKSSSGWRKLSREGAILESGERA